MELHSGFFGYYIFGDPLANFVLDFQAGVKDVLQDSTNLWHWLKQPHRSFM